MSEITVRIPTPLRNYAAGEREVDVSAATVGDAIEAVAERHPDLRTHLFDDEGGLRNFVNVYLNDEDARDLSGAETPVADRDRVTIVPSIAGGRDGSASPTHPADTADPEAAADPGGATDPAAVAAQDAAPPRPGPDVTLSNEEIRRYSRHLIMPEVGMEGQRKIKAARVLMVGAGGLGSPLGLYLAAAGVGTLGIVDFDVVDETNLQRQVLHGTKDVGRPKLDSATDRLHDVNPNVVIEPHETRLSSQNALEIVDAYDVVVDGTDNFPTRYLVNDACVLLDKPNVYGSIFRFEGQVSVFDARRGPCYRCLFREPPPPGLVPSCAEGGVLGVLPGIVGSLQALETIKVVLGAGDTLVGRLLLFDALAMEWREMRLRKSPDCPVCGEEPTVTELIDYDEFCGIPAAEAEEAREREGVPTITVTELKERLDRDEDVVVVDVREPHEWEIVNLERHGARLIPLDSLPERMNELDTAREIVLHCRTGARSARALELLREAGFRRLYNLEGGILAWAEEVEPELPKY